MNDQPAARVVGVVPWLPWPLSAWDWWARPVRAEKLAVLRITLALCLLTDLLLTYGPHLHDYFGPDSLGAPEIYAWRANAPRLTWSLLRGIGDAQLSTIVLGLLGACTLWILGVSLAAVMTKPQAPAGRARPGLSLFVWSVTASLFTAGVWARLVAEGQAGPLAWLVPLVLVGLAGLFLLLDGIRQLRERRLPGARAGWTRFLVPLGVTLVLLGAGFAISQAGMFDRTRWGPRLLMAWQDDPDLLKAAFIAWIAATLLLLVGLFTRPAAVLAWALSLSFSNINSSLENAGDQVRVITLFYLMLAPCAAAWSLDALWRRGSRRDEVRFVSPWVLRLLFVQMVFIYFCNGLYKLMGSTWWSGDSLYYALGDLTLTRISLLEMPLTLEATRWLTWGVLVWEVGFPLLVLWRWTRIPALVFGVLFHLGIFACMELGFFVPYMLCLYAPLLPWGGRSVAPPNPAET